MSQLLRRTILAALAVLLVAGLALPAGAAGMALTQAETEVTEAPAVEYQGPDAFIPVTEVPEEQPDLAWTYKFLIPTTMVLIAVLVIALVVGYFLRVVRARYTVAK